MVGVINFRRLLCAWVPEDTPFVHVLYLTMSVSDKLCFIAYRSGEMYYMPGLIMLTFLLMVVVCAEFSVLLCFIHLCAEDYRWWWRSFLSSGTSAFYVFLFSIYYFVKKTSITGPLSYLLYFGYTLIIVFLFFIATGNDFSEGETT